MTKLDALQMKTRSCLAVIAAGVLQDDQVAARKYLVGLVKGIGVFRYRNKKVPPRVAKATEEKQAAYIRGIFGDVWQILEPALWPELALPALLYEPRYFLEPEHTRPIAKDVLECLLRLGGIEFDLPENWGDQLALWNGKDRNQIAKEHAVAKQDYLQSLQTKQSG